jgi:hypothetical protein
MGAEASMVKIRYRFDNGRYGKGNLPIGVQVMDIRDSLRPKQILHKVKRATRVCGFDFTGLWTMNDSLEIGERVSNRLKARDFVTESDVFYVESREVESCGMKPAIYFYPTAAVIARVRLEFPTARLFVYPPFTSESGWEVELAPGEAPKIAGREIPYLFWKGPCPGTSGKARPASTSRGRTRWRSSSACYRSSG